MSQQPLNWISLKFSRRIMTPQMLKCLHAKLRWVHRAASMAVDSQSRFSFSTSPVVPKLQTTSQSHCAQCVDGEAMSSLVSNVTVIL